MFHSTPGFLIRNILQPFTGESSGNSFPPSFWEGNKRGGLTGASMPLLRPSPNGNGRTYHRVTGSHFMKLKHYVTAFLLLCSISLAVAAQEDKKIARTETPEARTKDGKRLLTAMDLMRVSGISAPRISADGSR